MATTYLSKTQVTGTSTRKMTISAWVKIADPAVAYAAGAIWSMGSDSSNFIELQFNDANRLELRAKNSGSYVLRKATAALFKDTSAWYHIVVGVDSDQVSGPDRNKIYINGVQYAGTWDTDTDATINTDFKMNSSSEDARCGRDFMSGASDYFDGEMAHVHYIDGTQYAASDFGETDTTSGIWVAKTSPSVTYGNNGGFYKFASGASGADSSGNGNTMAVSGTLTNLKDNPDNNFCALNPLDNYYASITYTNGNTTATSSTPYGYSRATIGLATGKWYWEVKATTIPAPDYITGIASTMSTSATVWSGQNAGSYGYNATDGKIYNSASGSAYGNTYSAGNIIGVYLDLDNSKLYFAINGTLQNSGTGHSITAVGSTDDGIYTPTAGAWTGTTGTVADFNFGNGYFGTTAVSSAVADAGGIGAFEYDPSAGTFDGSSKDFRAICTNNLATYG